MYADCEFRSVIKFLLNLNKSNKEIFEMLSEGYGNNLPHKTTIYRMINEFKHGGRTDVHNQKSTGRPQEIDCNKAFKKIESLIECDRRIGVSELALELNVSYGTCQSLLKDMGYRKLNSRFVAMILTPEMKKCRLEACQENLNLLHEHGPSFLKSLLTEDETSLSLFLPRSGKQNKYWVKGNENPHLQFHTGFQKRREFILSVFWSWDGVIFLDFLPKGQTVNGQYYADLLKKCNDVCPRKIKWFLQDNAPVHTANVAQEALKRCKFKPIIHPPYSPDLAPSDFFLFSRL